MRASSPYKRNLKKARERGLEVDTSRKPLSEDDKKKALVFMRESGKCFLSSPGLRPDVMHPDQPNRVSLAYVTDGEWIWGTPDIYYLEHYDVSPVPGFVEYMKRIDFKQKQPTEQQLQEAMKLFGWEPKRKQ